jgi:uncharacterized protein with HEPN domain
MPRRPLSLFDIQAAISDIRELHAVHGRDGLARERVLLRAFERCFKIVSEASRRIPEPWKAAHADVAWPRIAALGNRLRHNYDVVDIDTLIVIVEDHLPALAAAIEDMIAAHDPGPSGL